MSPPHTGKAGCRSHPECQTCRMYRILFPPQICRLHRQFSNQRSLISSFEQGFPCCRVRVAFSSRNRSFPKSRQCTLSASSTSSLPLIDCRWLIASCKQRMVLNRQITQLQRMLSKRCNRCAWSFTNWPNQHNIERQTLAPEEAGPPNSLYY